MFFYNRNRNENKKIYFLKMKYQDFLVPLLFIHTRAVVVFIIITPFLNVYRNHHPYFFPSDTCNYPSA